MRTWSASPPSSGRSPSIAPCSWSSTISAWSPISPTASPCSPAARSSPRVTTPPSRRTRTSSRPTWDRGRAPAMPEGSLLEVLDLHAWYGESHILHGVGFEVRAGEVVTLLGRNGAGKTTTLKSIMGMVPRRQGSIRFDGHELVALPSNRIARLGLAFCPEERGIFASLTVEENLLLPPVVRAGGVGAPAIYELFPNLPGRLRGRGAPPEGRGDRRGGAGPD